jgi:flagellin-like protein
MIEQLTIDTDDRGQVGIGTLIIFIALVLVAAVAAGVLIDTSGELESRASDTGDDAQAEVSNQIDVVSATGVDSGTSGGIDSITLVVKKSPGSDPIDLAGTTIQYQSGSSSQTLTYQASGSGGADGTHFTTNQVGGSGPTTVLDDNGERVKITIDADEVEGGTDLSEGSNVQLEIVDQSGASTVYGVNIPDVLTGSYVSV